MQVCYILCRTQVYEKTRQDITYIIMVNASTFSIQKAVLHFHLFYHDFNQDYYNESPISSIHHYSTVGDFEMFQQNSNSSAIQEGASNSCTRFFGTSFLLIPHQLLFLRCAYIKRVFKNPSIPNHFEFSTKQFSLLSLF